MFGNVALNTKRAIWCSSDIPAIIALATIAYWSHVGNCSNLPSPFGGTQATQRVHVATGRH